jgi:hypothetical protein
MAEEMSNRTSVFSLKNQLEGNSNKNYEAINPGDFKPETVLMSKTNST